MKQQGWLLSIPIFLVVLLCGWGSASEPAPATYTFGVVPQFEQRKLYAIWKPVIDELQRKTGLEFRLETTLKIGDFEKEYTRGSFDFVYMNPYYILKSTPSNEYIPLVRDKAPLRGVLVVCKDSALRSPAGLDGKVVAFPSPNALGASLLMRADLDRVFHVAVKPLYVKTHSSVYLHVATGLAAAGGGVEKSLREQPPEIRDSLRILYTTREMPSHPVAAHPRVAKEVREKVRQAFLEMGKSPEGRELLSKIPVRQMIPTSIEDYRPMFGWGLESYWDASWEGE